MDSFQHHANGFSSQIVKDVSTINTDNYDLEFEVEDLTTLCVYNFCFYRLIHYLRKCQQHLMKVELLVY